MRIGKPIALLIGVFTIWPIIYLCLFLALFVVTAFTIFGHSGQPPPLSNFFPYIVVLHVGTMLIMIALAAFYIVHVFKNPSFKNDRHILWAVILFFGVPVSAPVYWWLYIWPRVPAREVSV
jgi:hypothetical protein